MQRQRIFLFTTPWPRKPFKKLNWRWCSIIYTLSFAIYSNYSMNLSNLYSMRTLFVVRFSVNLVKGISKPQLWFFFMLGKSSRREMRNPRRNLKLKIVYQSILSECFLLVLADNLSIFPADNLDFLVKCWKSSTGVNYIMNE